MKEEKQLPCVEPGSVFIEEALFQRIIKMMPTNVFFKDRRARYRFVSNQCQTGFFQSAGDSVIGKTDLDLFDDPEVGVHLYREDLFVMESRIGKREMMDISLGGKTGYFDIRKNPVIDEDGKVLGISGVIHDLTKLREIERELYRQGILDALTGLYNRNHYRERKQTILAEENLPLSVILGDSNGLKYINDTFGHEQGDALLQETARILRQVSGEADELFRIGGDEFIMLCPNTDEKRCVQIIREIKNLEDEETYAAFSVNISLGYAVITSAADSFSESFMKAEEMMYREKRNAEILRS